MPRLISVSYTHLDVYKRQQQGYAETLPFADASFDVVISRYSAHHWHDVGQALREVKRVDVYKRQPDRCRECFSRHHGADLQVSAPQWGQR